MSSGLAASKPRITKISYTSPIATGTNFVLGDRHQKTMGQRILWVDLHEKAPQSSNSDSESSHYPDPQLYEEEIVGHMREVVVKDMRGNHNERIDSVRFDFDRDYQPKLEMWQALDGLSPKHLDLRCGWDEEAQFLALNDLRHQWKDLESLSLNSFCTNHFTSSDEVPRVFSQLSSLELIFCHGFNFIPPGGATKLTHLRIIGNNACEMFVMAFEGNPLLAVTLEVLDIKGDTGCDFQQYEPEDFRNRMKQCGHLRVLRLFFGPYHGVDVELASHIPPSVEELRLEITRSSTFLRDMDSWISHMSDAAWLPNLKSFHIELDTNSAVTDCQKRQGDELPDDETESEDSDSEMSEDSETSEDVETPYISSIQTAPSPEFNTQSFDLEFDRKKKILCDLFKSTRASVDC